jgi:hypothetical protein
MSAESADSSGMTTSYPPFADSHKLDQAVERIAQALLDGRAHFLFGAGMSKDSGIPQGYELATKMLAQYFPAAVDAPSQKRLEELAKEYPLETIATAVEVMPGKGRADLTTRLQQILFENLKGTQEAHTQLVSLCFWDGHQRVTRIFTTNFDMLLEDAFDKKGKSIGHEDDPEIGPAEHSGFIPIIHLHGKLNGVYEITEADVFRPMPTEMQLRFQLALSEADAFVFVGYSLSDPDFRSIYRQYRERILKRPSGPAKEDKTTYVVAPEEDRHKYKLGADIWLDRGAVWIPLTALDFFRRLRFFLEHKMGTKELATLQQKCRIADSDVFSQKVAQIADILCLETDDALGFMMDARMVSGGAR